MTADAERLAAIRSEIESGHDGKTWQAYETAVGAEYFAVEESRGLFAAKLAPVTGTPTYGRDEILHAIALHNGVPVLLAELDRLAAECDAEKERAARLKACVEADDALLGAVIEAMGSRPDRDPVIAARELLAERDALQARIAAVTVDMLHVDEATNGYVLAAAITARLAGADDDGVDRAIKQAHEDLAGDQPEATPEPPERPHGAEALHEAGEAAIAFIESLPSTEPPHLDPLPMIWVDDTMRHEYTDACESEPDCVFDPRPFDENGKAYSDKQEEYKRGTV